LFSIIKLTRKLPNNLTYCTTGLWYYAM
jgi:hypothetical protein